MNESIPLGLVYLPVALVLGALHALEPGHGKALASAYLASGEHSKKDALLLGLATTISHTAMVILLAGAALWLKGYVSQDTLQHGISTVGSLALIGVGGWQVLGAVSSIRHGHSHGHSHAHAEHLPHNFRGVFILGLSNGVLPCPGALAALLVAISMEKIGLGLMTVLVYSLGLALALTGICLVVLEAGKKARTWLPSDTALLWLPLGSGVLVMGTGLWMLKIFG